MNMVVNDVIGYTDDNGGTEGLYWEIFRFKATFERKEEGIL